ncbi:MAG: DUF4974 domain-containing protein [Prevotella sp.]|nr:DUF4974 domain-containing protein [Prevotella sp.]
MNKTDLLFQMMERPQEYSEEQWQEVLADDECRELYNLMSKTQSAFDMQKNVTDDEIDAEWQRLGKHRSSFFDQGQRDNSATEHSSFSKVLRITKWQGQAAAMFIGILLISGIAFAAIHIAHHYSHDVEEEPTVETIEKKSPTIHQPASKDTIVVAQPIVFDNISLDKIVHAIADYHQMETEVKNDQATELRFYFVWKQTDSLQTVVEQLNQFESVDIVVENEKLIVR